MSEIRVDTISEKTSANGVAVDGVTIKDGGISATTQLDVQQSTTDMVGLSILNTNNSATTTSSQLRIGMTNSAGASYAVMKVQEGGSDDYPDIIFGVQNAVTTTPTERMRIKDTGQVGIGTSAPVVPLSVKGSQEQLTLSEGDNRGATFDYRSSTGNLNITTNGGNARTAPQLALHLNGVLSATAGVALGVGAANTASNVLDDYEEGTWTPTFSGTSSAPSGVGYNGRNGSYTKIGRLVYVRMWLDLASWSSGPTGNATITGLPFTTNSTSLNFPAVVIGYAATWDTDNTPGGGTADPNATFIYLRKRDSADARDNINTTVSANAMNGTENLTLTMVYETA